MHHLGKNMRYLRKLQGKTQTDIAQVINKGHTTIGNWEKEVSEPSIDELILLSKHFGVSIDSLILTDMEAEGGEAKVPPVDKLEETRPLTYILQQVKAMQADIEKLKGKIK